MPLIKSQIVFYYCTFCGFTRHHDINTMEGPTLSISHFVIRRIRNGCPALNFILWENIDPKCRGYLQSVGIKAPGLWKHDDVIKWKHFPRYWPFVRGIHRSPVNSPQRPVTRSFDVFLDLGLNKRLSKQSRRRWFETPSHPLWRHCNKISNLIMMLLSNIARSKCSLWEALIMHSDKTFTAPSPFHVLCFDRKLYITTIPLVF